MHRITERKKLLVTAAVVAAVGLLAALGSYSAFSATTSNTGNAAATGTVSLTNSDGGTGKLYSVTGNAPGAGQTGKCLRVTYGGSLAATVKLYRSGALSNGADYALRVERGSGLTGPAADMNCTGFTTAAELFNGDLVNLGTTYAGGIDAKGSAWSSGNTVDYRFTITTKDDTTTNAHTTDHATGSHDFVWEAQSN
jgi:hypothetical protein